VDDHELGGLQRREAHRDVDLTGVDGRLNVVFGVAFDEVGFFGLGAWSATRMAVSRLDF